jgi:hypothetical protein
MKKCLQQIPHLYSLIGEYRETCPTKNKMIERLAKAVNITATYHQISVGTLRNHVA